MDKDDFYFGLRVIGSIAFALLVLFILIKIAGYMFDMPKDYGRRISEQNIATCVQKGGTPIMDDAWYLKCEGAKNVTK